MAHKKDKERLGPLGEPIVIPFHWPAVGETFEYKPQGLAESLEKLYLLFEYYKVEKNNWQALVFAMALDLVPGFRTVYDDPLAGAMGLPVKGGAKANRAGTGVLPELHNDRLLKLVDVLKIGLSLDTDRACAAAIYDYFWPKPAGRIMMSQKDGAIKTIATRISKARLRQKGPAEIVRRSKDV